MYPPPPYHHHYQTIKPHRQEPGAHQQCWLSFLFCCHHRSTLVRLSALSYNDLICTTSVNWSYSLTSSKNTWSLPLMSIYTTAWVYIFILSVSVFENLWCRRGESVFIWGTLIYFWRTMLIPLRSNILGCYLCMYAVWPQKRVREEKIVRRKGRLTLEA